MLSKAEQYKRLKETKGVKSIHSLIVRVLSDVEIDMSGVGANIHNGNPILRVYANEDYVVYPNDLYINGEQVQITETCNIGKTPDLAVVGYDSNFNLTVRDREGSDTTYSLIGDITDLSNEAKLEKGQYITLFSGDFGCEYPNDIDVTYETLLKYFRIVGVSMY